MPTPPSWRLDHPGRAFLALAVFYRHAGLGEDEPSPHLRELASTRILDRARILGATMRVAYLVSASMPGVLERAPLKVEKGKLVLRLEGDLKALDGERLFNRLRSLGKLIGREPVIRGQGDRSRSIATTRPASTASATPPRFNFSASFPNISRRQPFIAGTSGLSSKRSVEVVHGCDHFGGDAVPLRSHAQQHFQEFDGRGCAVQSDFSRAQRAATLSCRA